MILTLVWTIAVLCCLIFFTVWYTSTTASVLILSIKFVNAMNTPVRPTPALEIKNERYRKKLTHFNLFQSSVASNIETRHLFWCATEMTGFYVKSNTGRKLVTSMLCFYTPWKHPKNIRFCDVLRGYRNGTLA